MFTSHIARRACAVRSSVGPSTLRHNVRTPLVSRRYVQQGYGDDADASIADTPEARREKSGQSHTSTKRDDSEGKSSKADKSSNSGATKSSSSKGTEGAQPKILDTSPPHEGQEPDDVKQHNDEVRQRADKAHEKVNDEDLEKDKVGKRFWSGHGGVDKDP